MSNSDSGEKKAGVPSWQVNSDQKLAEEDAKPVPEPDSSREAVLEQAKKFLEEDEVKDAPTEKKIAFLEKKGLQNDEIQQLLGISRNMEASGTIPSTDAQTPSSSLSLGHSHTPSQPLNLPSPQQQTYTAAAPRAAPIITYPEFLTTSPHPSPLITKHRLLSTLYAFSTLSLLLYGTSTYLVTPMISSLTLARLELASSASINLQKLIERLEKMVSAIPESHREKAGEEEGGESEDEDPTELFHRDIGVQTSPPRSPSLSPSRLAEPSALETQTTRLTSLSKSLQGLVSDFDSSGEETSELSTTIGFVREVLDGMAYVPPVTNYAYGGYGVGAAGSGKDDDEIAKVKAGIRGVKGVLLSARSFPGGIRAGGR